MSTFVQSPFLNFGKAKAKKSGTGISVVAKDIVAEQLLRILPSSPQQIKFLQRVERASTAS